MQKLNSLFFIFFLRKYSSLTLLLFFSTFVIVAQGVAQEIIRRAAFDFGSGSIKLQVSDVDVETNTILTTHFITNIKVPFLEDLAVSPTGSFSSAIEQKAFDALFRLKNAAEEYGAEAFSGFATEAFRKANNGEELLKNILERTGIFVHLVSQEMEAELGFRTALLLSEEKEDNVLAWDSGAGSTQLVVCIGGDLLQSIQMPLGAISSAHLILSAVQGRPPEADINPMSAEEFSQSIDLLVSMMPDMPEEWREREWTVLAVGAFPKWQNQSPRPLFTEVVISAMERLDKSAVQLGPNAVFHTATHLLAVSLMKKYGFHQVRVVGSPSGNGSAFLTKAYFWTTPVQRS